VTELIADSFEHSDRMHSTILGMVIGSVRSFTSTPLASLLLVTLLALIAVVLVVPEIDLPDATCQGCTAPLAAHSHTHHTSQGATTGGELQFSSVLPTRTTYAWTDRPDDDAVELSLIPHPILRC
jgi:hypothetical protein